MSAICRKKVCLNKIDKKENILTITDFSIYSLNLLKYIFEKKLSETELEIKLKKKVE